ncbi:MAG: hypothetical protein GY865_07485, partial [candidate division Zixibacteria bacterium]|nr:hypothetical protein [candidate division Zixibacteria bacterium]
MMKLIIIFCMAILAIGLIVPSVFSDDNSSDYLCGDVNNDQTVNLVDIVRIYSYLFHIEPGVEHIERGDVDSLNGLTMNDIAHFTRYNYFDGADLFCSPFPDSVLQIYDTDTLSIQGLEILSGNNYARVDLYIKSTKDVKALSVPLSFDCSTSEIICDSISTINSIEDTPLDAYIIDTTNNKILIGLWKLDTENDYPIIEPGSERLLASLWFTVTSSAETQYITIDITDYPPSNIFIFSEPNNPYVPEVVSLPTNNCVDSDNDAYGDPGNPENDCPDDNCPDIPNSDQADLDNDGIGDVCDECTDTDGDGNGNPGFPANTCPDDNCVDIANPDNFNYDGDSFGNLCDNCPTVPNDDQADTDGDGVGNACDNCVSIPNTIQTNSDGDSFGDLCDNCPNFTSENQTDNDDDGEGDVCDDDDDDDGILDDGDLSGVIGDYPCPDGVTTNCDDNCSNKYNPTQEDADGDGIGDLCDNCPDDYNPEQSDNEGDGLGDICDDDDDDDGILDDGDLSGTIGDYPCPDGATTNCDDNCQYISNSGQDDSDADGEGDVCDWECGEANNDASLNIGDVVYISQYLLQNGPEPLFMESADVDSLDGITINDAMHILSYVFNCGGLEPYCPPFPDSSLQISDVDTLSFRGTEVLHGSNYAKVDLILKNTKDLLSLTIPLSFSCQTSDLICDSISDVNSICSESAYSLHSIDNSEYKVLLGRLGIFVCSGNKLISPGEEGLLASLWFTVTPSDKVQYVTLDVTDYPPSNIFIFSEQNNPYIPIIDYCADSDGDGYGNPEISINNCPDDNCPDVANEDQIDSDGDGAGDACDNCLGVSNEDQADDDNDNRGNICDNCIAISNYYQLDGDEDGVGNECDNCRYHYNPGQIDSDGNDIGDACTFEAE